MKVIQVYIALVASFLISRSLYAENEFINVQLVDCAPTEIFGDFEIENAEYYWANPQALSVSKIHFAIDSQQKLPGEIQGIDLYIYKFENNEMVDVQKVSQSMMSAPQETDLIGYFLKLDDGGIVEMGMGRPGLLHLTIEEDGATRHACAVGQVTKGPGVGVSSVGNGINADPSSSNVSGEFDDSEIEDDSIAMDHSVGASQLDACGVSQSSKHSSNSALLILGMFAILAMSLMFTRHQSVAMETKSNASDKVA